MYYSQRVPDRIKAHGPIPGLAIQRVAADVRRRTLAGNRERVRLLTSAATLPVTGSIYSIWPALADGDWPICGRPNLFHQIIVCHNAVTDQLQLHTAALHRCRQLVKGYFRDP